VKQRLVAFFRHHLEEIVTPRFDELTRQIEEVRQATVEIRRIVTDDLDASNEAAASLGRAVARLQASVDELQAGNAPTSR
jgi:hypothetical protein